MRLFIAIEMPSLVIEQARQIQEHLHGLRLFKGPYAKPNTMHITLKFLGDVADVDMPVVQDALRSIKFSPMHCQLGAVDTFAAATRIKVIYLHLICPQLVDLARIVDDTLPTYPKEERDFISHLTLARVKGVDDREKLLQVINAIQVPKIEFTIAQFVLKKSELTPEGPIYTDVEQYKLL